MKNRNYLAVTPDRSTRRQLIAGAAVASGFAMAPGSARAAGEGISHTAESIHQEPVFQASRKRVYEVLTDAKEFGKVVELSAAMKSMSSGSKLTEISPQAGGAFALFGGYITGRNIELVSNERIVQAWRVGAWNPGVYSIAKFELTEEGSATKIVFDHTGFPEGKGASLAAGWIANYWEPLRKYLA